MNHYYFHIGQPKTGSTSLQNFVRRNEPRFLNDGIYLPKFGRIHERYAWHQLAWGARQPQSRRYTLGLSPNEMAQQLSTEVEESGYDKFLISSEAFWCPNETPELFLSHLPEGRWTILAWLRPLDELVESLHNHHVRDKDEASSLEAFARGHTAARFCRRWDALAPWVQTFGAREFRVHLMHSSQPSSQVYDELLSALSLQPGPEWTTAAPQNTARGWWKTERTRMATDLANAHASVGVTGYLSAAGNVVRGFGSRGRLSGSTRDFLNARGACQEARIAQAFFNRSKLFVP